MKVYEEVNYHKYTKPLFGCLAILW